MKSVALIKIVTVVSLSGFISACSNTPKKPIEPPTLGAAIAAPAPAPEIVETPRGPSLTLDSVLFDFEAASLRPEAYTTVEKAASYLNSNPDKTALVEGHTDHTGESGYNQHLSAQRSESIKDALMELGINESRIRTTGLGETNPVADNGTFEGRQANRRVEVIFIGAE